MWQEWQLLSRNNCVYQGERSEKDIETRLTKAWTAINRLSIIWKSDLTDKMKRSFFQEAVTSIMLYGCTTWTLTKRLEKKLDGNYELIRDVLLWTPHMAVQKQDDQQEHIFSREVYNVGLSSLVLAKMASNRKCIAIWHSILRKMIFKLLYRNMKNYFQQNTWRMSATFIPSKIYVYH